MVGMGNEDLNSGQSTECIGGNSFINGNKELVHVTEKDRLRKKSEALL